MRYGTLDAQGRPVYAGTIFVDGKPVANPTREMYLAQGQKPFLDGARPPAAKSGTHYVRAGWTEKRTAIVPKWRLVADASSRIVRVSKAKVEAAVDRMGLTAQFTAWLNSKAAYIGAWMRGGDAVPYDPSRNSGDLASLIAALGIPQENVAALIEEVRAD